MPRLSSRKSRLFALLTVVAAAGVAFGALQVAEPAHAGTLSAAQLDQLATSFAAGLGESSPSSISYVTTTLQAAEQLVSGNPIGSDAASYLIVERGSFTDTADAPPGSSTPISGSVLTIIVDEQSGKITGYGVSNNVPALTSLGPVSSLTP